jgi:NADH-quinone oxidoreductase subunit A
MPYECGKDPVGSARDRFSIKFYNVAVIFLLFDIEVLFMIPFSVAFKELFKINASYGTIAFIEIMFFIATLVIGLIYAWKKGTFDWNVQARAEAKAEAKELKRTKLKMVEELKRAA